jgi:hypothetical protein
MIRKGQLKAMGRLHPAQQFSRRSLMTPSNKHPAREPGLAWLGPVHSPKLACHLVETSLHARLVHPR